MEQYLPFAAASTSAEEQAKVSLLLEALLRRSLPLLKVEDKEMVLEAVEVGSDKRQRIARERMSRRKKKSSEEEMGEREAWKWLCESGGRMRVVVELLE